MATYMKVYISFIDFVRLEYDGTEVTSELRSELKNVKERAQTLQKKLGYLAELRSNRCSKLQDPASVIANIDGMEQLALSGNLNPSATLEAYNALLCAVFCLLHGQRPSCIERLTMAEYAEKECVVDDVTHTCRIVVRIANHKTSKCYEGMVCLSEKHAGLLERYVELRKQYATPQSTTFVINCRGGQIKGAAHLISKFQKKLQLPHITATASRKIIETYSTVYMSNCLICLKKFTIYSELFH